jgi:hypothetical protein
MKINSGYLIKEIAGTTIIISVGKVADYSKIITLPNPASVDVFQWIQDGTHLFNPEVETIEEYAKHHFEEYTFTTLLEKMTSEYNVEVEEAKTDLLHFLKMLYEKNILEPDAELAALFNEH